MAGDDTGRRDTVVAPDRSRARNRAPRAPDVVVAHGIGRGPHQLGRNVVVADGGDEPVGLDRLRTDPRSTRTSSAEPLPTVERLRAAAFERRGVVIELVDDTAPPAVERRPIHELGARFAFDGDELHHLTWSNSIDGRDPAAPSWCARRSGGGARRDVRRRRRRRAPRRHGRLARRRAGALHRSGRRRPRAPRRRRRARIARARRCRTSRAPTSPPINSRRSCTPVAPPASSPPPDPGKTRVLTERARHLLVGVAAAPERRQPRRLQQAGAGGDARTHGRPPRSPGPHAQRDRARRSSTASRRSSPNLGRGARSTSPMCAACCRS